MLFLFLTACFVSREYPASYAHRAHPECSGFSVESHTQTERGSESEVSMICSGVRRVIAIKCTDGRPLSDISCHENN